MYQLTKKRMVVALHQLAGRDELMATLFSQYGVPPLLSRSESFATLVHIVLEQKVSLTSAAAIMRRVEKACPGMQPDKFLVTEELRLRDAGMSQSKVTYCRSIAQNLVSKNLSLQALRKLDDEQVIETLTQVRGIGPWTAGVYLMMAMRRADAWASGDRALLVSYAESADLKTMPDYSQLDSIASQWTPHRGTAARLLWHAYLEKRNRDAC